MKQVEERIYKQASQNRQQARQDKLDAMLANVAKVIARTWIALFALVLVIATAPLYFIMDYQKLARFANKTASVFAAVAAVGFVWMNPWPDHPVWTFILAMAGFAIFLCDHGDECFG